MNCVDGLLDSLVGVWKLQKTENFDAYLKAHGVGFVARALVAFLDFNISIARRKDGLRVIIHDYVSEFSVGVPQPLLEHPVTKRQDQSVIVSEEDGKLVCSISESGGFGSGCVDSVVGGSVNSGCVGSVCSGGVGVSEVIILEMLDSSSRIKQTLKFSHVTCHRWYVRDPNATNVAAVGVNGNADAAVAAAAATTAATADIDNNAPNDSQNNNNNAANDNIDDGKDTKAPNVDDKHVAKESGEAEAGGGGGGGRGVAEERLDEETAVKKKAERRNRKAKSRSRKTKGEETEERGKGEEEVGEAVKEKAEETAEETAGKVTGLCADENNNETGTENNNNKNNNQIEDEEDNNNKPKKKGSKKFQCLLSLAFY